MDSSQTGQPFDDRLGDAARAGSLYGDSAARARGQDLADGEGMGTLVSGLIGDLQEIVRGEVRLAKAELREDATQIGGGVGLLAGGAFVGLTGFIFLMLAATYLLNTQFRMWVSAGIVALALLVVAAILALVGKSRLSAANLKPAQTIASLKEDREWAKQQISSVKR